MGKVYSNIQIVYCKGKVSQTNKKDGIVRFESKIKKNIYFL